MRCKLAVRVPMQATSFSFAPLAKEKQRIVRSSTSAAREKVYLGARLEGG